MLMLDTISIKVMSLNPILACKIQKAYKYLLRECYMGRSLVQEKRNRKCAVCLLLLHLFSEGITDGINQGFGVGVGVAQNRDKQPGVVVGVGVGQAASTQNPGHGPRASHD